MLKYSPIICQDLFSSLVMHLIPEEVPLVHYLDDTELIASDRQLSGSVISRAGFW